MNVAIQSVKFDADQKLKDFITDRMNKLEKFLDRTISSEVILKIDKDSEHGNKVALMTIEIPGGNLVAERKAKKFEEAIDLCIEAVKKQNEKHKEKLAY